MKIIKIWLVGILLLMLSTGAAYGWTQWQTLKTRNFTVFYQAGHEAEAKETLQTLEFYRSEVEKFCGNGEYHLSIVIDDIGIQVNGFSNPLTSNIHLFSNAPSTFAGTENWWSLVGVHEYTHELSISKTVGLPRLLTKIFGKSVVYTPNFLLPEWLIEGLAVYNESQITRYQGRLNDGLYDAYIAARVKDGRFPSIADATNAPFEYQAGGVYTYGGAFVNYLATTYGSDKLTRFLEINGSKIGAILFTPAIGIDSSAKQIFGKSFPELWRDWQRYETGRHKNFQYEGRQLTHHGWEIINLKINGEKLYYQRYYPEKTAAFSEHYKSEIVERELKTGRERILVATTSSFAADFQIRNQRIYYAVKEVRSGYANASNLSYGYYAKVYQYDLATQKTRKLFQGELRSFEVLENGEILYGQSLKGEVGSELYRWNPKTSKSKLVLRTPYLIDDMESEGERLVVRARRDWESDDLYRLNLERKEFLPLVQTAFLERGLELHGERLFFTANYQKQNAVYCYYFSSGKVCRVTQNGWIENVAYDSTQNQVYFTQLNSYGMDLYQKNATFQEFNLPTASPTVRPIFKLDEVAIEHGDYRDNLKTLVPKLWYPLIDTDQEKYGFGITGGDAVMDFPSYSATIQYNSKTKSYEGTLELPINFAAPFAASVSWEKTADENTKKLTLLYPVMKRLDTGISQLDLGSTLSYEKDYQGAEVAPFIKLGFKYPQTRLNFAASFPQSTLTNDQERSGVYGQATIKQYMAHSEVSLAASFIDDPDNPDTDLFSMLRGYNKRLPAKQGRLLTVEYSRPLLKIRKGFWNLDYYVEDLCGTVFYDQAAPKTGADQSSWGVELHLESQIAYGKGALDIGSRYVRNREGEVKYEVFLKL